jgi:DNA-binding SARP family transcriptional activator
MLEVRLLGGLELRLGDDPLPPLDSARAESLLAYLLIHREAPQPRQRLAFLLWPDSTEAQARTNLRHVLHNLRRALPDADRYLDVTPRTLRWRPEAAVALDLAEFEAALDRDDLETAVAAYGGDLLEGSYDEWLLEERERVRDRLVGALERLAERLEQRGEHAAAVGHAERLLRLEPLREDAYRRLMRLHDAAGDRARALRVYHACVATLERDLGVAPSAATREAYEALLAGAGDAEPELVAFVGRAPERRQLSALWREAARGRAQLVLITGEAGIGKSRLLEELRTFCAHRGAATAEARSYPAEGALAYGPVAAWLRAEPLAGRRHRRDRGRRIELARVLPELDESPRPLPESEQRARLFDALAHAVGVVEPLLLVADDVQWSDPETLQFLHYLVRSRPAARLLVAASARREELDEAHGLHELLTGLAALDRATEIALPPLSAAETAVLAGPGVDAERLFAETEGNPLFVVETLRAGEPAPRVQAVLEARLAQLSDPARRLAAVAAAVGRDFTADVLARASGAGAGELVRALDELWRRRIVRDRGPEAYDFAHEKLREAAYATLGPAERRRTHLRIARALPGRDHARVAHHYDRAGAVDDAVEHYERAAVAAQRMHAHGDAVRLLERAADLTPDPARRLAILTDLAAPLGTVEGHASPHLIEQQQRALALAGELGVDPAPPLLRSLALVSIAAHDLDAARRHGRLLRHRAARDADAVLLVESSYILGIGAFWQGDLAAARDHFEDAVAAYRPEDRVTHLIHYGFDTHVICLSRLANTLWYLGEEEAAVAARERALELAEEIGDRTTTGITLVFAGLLALEQGDLDALRAYTARLAEHDMPPIVVTHELYAGYLDVVDGRPGVERIRRAIAGARGRDHAPGLHATAARVLVEACVIAGDRSGLDVPVPEGLFEDTVRRLRGTLAERTALDRLRP